MVKEIKLDKLTGKSFEDLMSNNPNELFELLDGLEVRQFTIADINIDHRSILHWEKEEIIDKIKDTKDGWRKYSFFDYVWLRIVMDMREFGISIPIIRNVKPVLFYPVYKELIGQLSVADIEKINSLIGHDATERIEKLKRMNEKPDMELHNKMAALTRFVFVIVNVIISRAPTYLLLQKSGNIAVTFLVEPDMEEKISQTLQLFEKESTLLINITKIIDEFFSGEKFNGSTYYKLSPLSRQEKEIIQIIRSGGVRNINITLKDGGQFYAEILRKKPASDVMEQIQGIIAKSKYSRITLDTENGKVSYINEIEKRIIK